MTSEDGFSLIELLVAMSAGVIVALGAFTLVDAAGRQSNKQVTRVDANQRARPVLQNLMDDLHNTCIGPNVVPVSPGSTDSSLAFTMPTPATQSGVTPTAEEHVVSLSSGVLTETTYPATNTTAPWTFSATPNGPAPGPPPGPRTLMTGVGQAAIGGTTVPVFQYFAYNGAQISTTPLPTPLSATNAALTAQVTVAFSVSPNRTTVPDPNSAIPITDTAILRLSPAAEDPSKANPPCS